MTDDPPITAEELFNLQLIRIGKEPSRAVRSEYYGRPENVARFESEKKGGVMYRDLSEAETLLLKWADWMRQGGGNVAGMPRRSLGFIDSWIKDSEEIADAADSYQMGKINAAIESLISPHVRIIHKVHGLGYMVWSFSNEAALYHAAQSEFLKKYFAKS